MFHTHILRDRVVLFGHMLSFNQKIRLLVVVFTVLFALLSVCKTGDVELYQPAIQTGVKRNLPISLPHIVPSSLLSLTAAPVDSRMNIL